MSCKPPVRACVGCKRGNAKLINNRYVCYGCGLEENECICDIIKEVY